MWGPRSTGTSLDPWCPQSSQGVTKKPGRKIPDFRSCPGFFPDAPVWSGSAVDGFTRISVAGEMGIVLALKVEDGSWECLEPGTSAETGHGEWEAWVGSLQPGLQHPFVLTAGRADAAGKAGGVAKGLVGGGASVGSEWASMRGANTRFEGPVFLTWDPESLPASVRLKGRFEKGDGPLLQTQCPGEFQALPHATVRIPPDGRRRSVEVLSKHSIRVLGVGAGGEEACLASKEASGTHSVAMDIPVLESLVDFRLHVFAEGDEPVEFSIELKSEVLAGPERVVAGELAPVEFKLDKGAMRAVEQKIVGGVVAPIPPKSRAVARILESGGGFLCTGTIVEVKGALYLLTAAHCLFEVDPLGRMLRMRRTVKIEGVGSARLSEARVHSSFQACVGRRMTYHECLASGGLDATLVPLGYPAAVLSSWRLCDRPPFTTEITAFGYGWDGRAMPSDLLMGDFYLEGGFGRIVIGRGRRRVALGPGDSGGPAVPRSLLR